MNTTNGEKDPIASRIGIYLFPSVKLIKDGESRDYLKDVNAHMLSQWIDMKTRGSIINIESC